MDKVFKFIKEQFYKLIMGVLAFMATGFLYGTYENTKQVPELKKQVSEIWDRFVDVNTDLYKLKMKMHDDSIRNGK